jgi:hypothetical protein
MNAVFEHEKTAYEEAGHAVIHHHFRREIAEVVATGEGSSYCQLARGESAFNLTELARHESLCRSIMAKLAAKCVAQRLGGYEPAEWRASSDFVKASRFAFELNKSDQRGADLLLAWLERKTELLIEQHWREIGAVAYGLLNTGRLSGSQVRGIIESTRAKQL